MKLALYIFGGLLCSIVPSIEGSYQEIYLSYNENFKFSLQVEKLYIASKFSRHLLSNGNDTFTTIGIDNGVIVRRDTSESGFKVASQEYPLDDHHSHRHGQYRRGLNDENQTIKGKSTRVSLHTWVPDFEWYGKISIGTPPQQVLMDFDTGSPSFWVISPHTVNETPSNHSVFDPKASRSFKNSSGTFSIAYGDGTNSRGYIGYDDILLGSLKVTQQAIDIANIAYGFNNDLISGIIGLSFDTVVTSSVPVKTLLDNMVIQGIDKPEFGVQLIKGSPRNQGKGGGKYIFGGYDKSVISGNIVTLPVENFGNSGKSYWAVTIDDIKINNKSVRIDGKPSNVLSIFDTGTALIYLDDITAADIHKQVPGATNVHDYWQVPCDVSGPTIYITLGGQNFGIPMADLASTGSLDGKLCISGIQGGQTAVSASGGKHAQPLYFLFGTVFIKNNYLIFNQGGSDAKSSSTIGFAKRNDIILP